MLARRLPSILPPLTPNESLETTRIYSAMGLLRPGEPLMAIRPFRAPHHSVSDAGLVGGGSTPSPGEISLAHKGVLFLDELPEFNRKTLEVLRQPLEEGSVTISRALRSTCFPADFILVSAMNPCPCGYRTDPRRQCTCTLPQVEKYLSRISGPLLDRIDLHVEVPGVPFAQLSEAPPGPNSTDLRGRVLSARARQSARFGSKGPGVNGRMTPRQVRKFCTLRPEAANILKGAMDELGLSARAHDKILRVARTMADLDDTDEIQPHHVAEAVGFRTLDRSVWS
jgi:magnesium chelatase family protein